ncbi:hypothetical protein D9C73_023117 [Collichthys lucidus]|uniref:Uncharacterized protein n=1 Tax=Collichthys lucidus TaxID=240159 RepID=A0A4U5VJC2_COLLU|nr:hypothetical protein D9C73_023117 [Collichthys lucidus]
MEHQRTLHCQVRDICMFLTTALLCSSVSGIFPSVKLVGAKAKCDSGTIIGLSLLTLCFSQETQNSLYLCHVCEEKVSSDRITSHVCSRDHCSNYFNYTDPNVLSFAWMPSMDMRVILQARLTKEEKEEGPGQLQMLDLPKDLLQKFERCIYSEVMGTLSENDKLVKLLEALKELKSITKDESLVTNIKPGNKLECRTVSAESASSYKLRCQLYQNPWRLPLAWDNRLDFEGLRAMAWEQEKERGPNEMVVKFHGVRHTANSSKTRDFLCSVSTTGGKKSEIRMDGCECFWFHLIAGQQFLVRPDMYVSHHEPIETRYLCLLCQRTLSNDECYAHVFSREHIAAFLVEKMDSDDNSEDPEAQLSSVTAAVCVMTETTSKTTEVPPELTEDVKMTQIKMSGEKNKTKVIPNTTVGQTIPSCTKASTSKLTATATPNPNYSTTFKPEKAPKHSTASKIGATVKMIKTSVQSENAEASAKTVPMKNSAGSNADVAPNIPKHAAPHLSALISVRPAESSHTSTSQTKTSEGPPKVGLNQLISVSCKGKRQVYCQLCSVRLKQSNHVLGFGHRYRYVRLEVHNYIYMELSCLPVVEALEKVKEMLRRRDSHASSSSTTDTADILRVVPANPLEVPSTNDCKFTCLGFVWECQGISQSTFFLCESCKEMLSISDICQHVVSDKHQLKYMQSHRSQFLWFLLEEDLLQQMKQELLKDIAFMLSEQEHDTDAQVVLLRQDLYEYVRTAPFSEALKLVKKIKEEPGVFIPIITLQQKDQQPEDRQCRGESFPTKKSIQALETDPRSDNDDRWKTEEHNFKSTAVVGIKQRSVLSLLDLNSVSSKADSVVSSIRAASACPQDTCRTLLTPPEIRPPVSQHQRPIVKLKIKETEVHPGFPSSSGVSPKTSQTTYVSPRDECLSTRKRPAVTPLPHLEHPLPAKCTRVSLQPRTESAPEFTPVNSAATSTLLSPEDKYAEPVSDKQDTSTFNWTKFAHLLALKREKKSEMKMSTYARCPNNAGTSNSCTDRSSESGLAIGGGNGTNKVPFLATPANNLQRFNKNTGQHQHNDTEYSAANSKNTAQALITVAPSVVNVTR